MPTRQSFGDARCCRVLVTLTGVKSDANDAGADSHLLQHQC